MREHKYHGMTKDGKWVEGYLFQIWDEAYILWGTTNGIPNMTEVIPSTVGEWTGKQDSKGRDIWENDKVRIKSDDYDYEYVSTVRWDEESGCLVLDYPHKRDYDIAPVGWILDLVEKENGTVEVIGHAQQGE